MAGNFRINDEAIEDIRHLYWRGEAQYREERASKYDMSLFRQFNLIAEKP